MGKPCGENTCSSWSSLSLSLNIDGAIGKVGCVIGDPLVPRRGDPGTKATVMSFCIRNCCDANGCGTDVLVVGIGCLGVFCFTFVGASGCSAETHVGKSDCMVGTVSDAGVGTVGAKEETWHVCGLNSLFL